jgi:hypothetical protein
MTEKPIKSIFHAWLNPLDSESQTQGCRHTNPDVCANHSLPQKCAFVREDGICFLPPKSWPKQYRHLKKTSEEMVRVQLAYEEEHPDEFEDEDEELNDPDPEQIR